MQDEQRAIIVCVVLILAALVVIGVAIVLKVWGRRAKEEEKQRLALTRRTLREKQRLAGMDEEERQQLALTRARKSREKRRLAGIEMHEVEDHAEGPPQSAQQPLANEAIPSYEVRIYKQFGHLSIEKGGQVPRLTCAMDADNVSQFWAISIQVNEHLRHILDDVETRKVMEILRERC